MYKYSEARAIAKTIESNFIPKKGGTIANVEGSINLYNEIREVIIKDNELDGLLKEVLCDSCYSSYVSD